MKKTYNIIGIILLLISMSCNEDLLEVDYKNGFIGENFMQSETQAQEAVTAIYDVLNWIGYYDFTSYILSEVPTDNIESEWGDGNFGPSIVAINSLNWLGNNRYFAERWNNGYAAIARANYVINKINDIDSDKISQEKREQYLGEALFLRGFFYYTLVTGFGEVPLVKKVLSAEEANTVNKAELTEILDQIINDLKQAQNLLPVSYSDGTDLGRATSNAAAALLSRVYLWNNEWQLAVDAANDVIGCSLVDASDYPGMFDGTKEFSVESIFEVIRIQDFGNMWSSTQSETSLLMHMAPRNPWGDYMHPRKKGNYDIINYH